MTDTDRLAALLRETGLDFWQSEMVEHPGDEAEHEPTIHHYHAVFDYDAFAARLVAQGVRVGDDGLRALLVKWRDAALDGDASMLGDLVDETNLALAATPAPTLDEADFDRATVALWEPSLPPLDDDA